MNIGSVSIGPASKIVCQICSQQIPELFDYSKMFKISMNARASTDHRRGGGENVQIGATGRTGTESVPSLGPIVFLDQITVPVHYLNFKRKAVPGATFHLGCESCGKPERILVPAETRYKVTGGVPGAEIIQLLQEAQSFFFDFGTQITIPANLPFSIGRGKEAEKEMFCQDTIVTMV